MACDQVLRGFQRNQAEPLRVLDRPDLPIHNNRGETDLRDRVKKRRISAGARSEVGRQCRDTFASLEKTCRKQGVSFWAYLEDRVAGLNVIPSLSRPVAGWVRRRPGTCSNAGCG
ncbi:MAG: transposase [Candidatus Contendobacter sp.]|nr:MAG: transposase [Candidatus Contendobacter sp.]